MDNLLDRFKVWFELRDFREKLLITGLSWAAIYAIFALILLNPLDNQAVAMAVNIKKVHDDIVLWQTQLKYLKSIPDSPLYKDWISNRNSYESLKNKYKNLLGEPVDEKWDNIINAVLGNYPNITIEHIQNSPEAVFQDKSSNDKSDSIYQQQAQILAMGNFPDIVGYISYIEKTVPNIHWDKLSYKVTEYPLAKVEMEISVLYEKTKP